MPGDCAALDIGTNPAAAKAGEMGSSTEASNPAATIGTAIGRSIDPIRLQSPEPPDSTSTCEGSSANGRARPRSRAQMSISCAGVAGQVIDTGREPRAAAGIVVASTISAIGVMPAMGSVENWPSEYETAPTRRPSTYTGLPLMPAMTPVLASGPPASLARIRLRLGPMTLRRTPRM